jgi:hypothetical protein
MQSILRRLAGGALSVLLIAALPAAARAQHCPPGHPGLGEVPCPLDAPRWSGELAVLGANSLLGAFTGGVRQRMAGGSFADGFTRGALGGAAIYAGKRVTAQRFDGAGLLGRQVAAVGVSIVDNAGAGRGTLERLVLPAWVGRLYVDVPIGGQRARVAPRLDAMAAFWTAYGIVEPELSLDVRASASAGTPVFLTDNRVLLLGNDSLHAGGVTLAGVIYLADVPVWGEFWSARALAHERVHTLQNDQLFLQWTSPIERRALRSVPGGRSFSKYVDLNLSTELLRLLSGAFPDHRERPWELEAFFLAH